MLRFNSIAIRLSDIAISCFALFLAAPIFLIIAITVFIGDGKSPFFLQERLGKNGLPFRIIKFRTMSWIASRNVTGSWATDDDPRITPVGRLLRKYHLDEIPQLINVLYGSMSLVGPRPFRRAVHEEIAAIEPKWDKRLAYKPGITGFAQLSIAKGITLADHASKIEQDLETSNLSLLKYYAILIKTPIKILAGNSH